VALPLQFLLLLLHFCLLPPPLPLFNALSARFSPPH